MLAVRTQINEIGGAAQPLAAASAPIEFNPEPLSVLSRNWTAWLGPLISAAVLVAVLYQLSSLDLQRIIAMIPASPLFWLVFAVFYLAQPGSDWIIFRRLWKIPIAGVGALIRKTVSNELLVSYLGEVQFYSWARRNGRMSAAPFGAVKDVAILSALAGNAVTLAMLVLTYPLMNAINADLPVRMIALSLAALLVTSAIPMVWRRRVFSLPRRQLWFAFNVHVGRLIVTTVLSALLWVLILPSVPFAWVMFLATMRLLIARLPFMPNKDLVFAGLAALLVGTSGDIAALMAMIAGLLLLTHMSFGFLTAAFDLAARPAR